VGVTVEIARSVDDELVDAFAVLMPQLSSSNPAPGRDELAQIVASETTVLFVARVEGRIAGALTLVVFRIPTGVRAWIEDVVVDSASRGHGVGEALNKAAIGEARVRGAVRACPRRGDGRSHVSTLARGREPALPTARFHCARDQRLQIRAVREPFR